MSCKVLILKSCEIYGTTFRGRKFNFPNRDISGDVFLAKVKESAYNNLVAEIDGVIVEDSVFFTKDSLSNLPKKKYKIEYWATFMGVATEIIAVENFEISASSSSSCGCVDSEDSEFILAFPEETIEVFTEFAVINIGSSVELPPNLATIDLGTEVGNVFTKAQSDALFMALQEFVTSGKIRADKIEALGLTELIQVTENTLTDFLPNYANYVYEKNDFIAIPDTNGNYSLYIYTGADKSLETSYIATGLNSITIVMVQGLQAALDSKATNSDLATEITERFSADNALDAKIEAEKSRNDVQQTQINANTSEIVLKADKSTTYTKLEIDGLVSSTFKAMGSVPDFASLPTVGNRVGDVYNTLEDSKNYVWVDDLNGTGVAGWDDLGGFVDLSGYATTVQLGNETTERIAADNAEITARQNADTAEVNARISADNALDAKIEAEKSRNDVQQTQINANTTAIAQLGISHHEYIKNFNGTTRVLEYVGKDFEVYENGYRLPNEAFSQANGTITFLDSAPFFTAQKTNAYIIINYKRLDDSMLTPNLRKYFNARLGNNDDISTSDFVALKTLDEGIIALGVESNLLEFLPMMGKDINSKLLKMKGDNASAIALNGFGLANYTAKGLSFARPIVATPMPAINGNFKLKKLYNGFTYFGYYNATNESNRLSLRHLFGAGPLDTTFSEVNTIQLLLDEAVGYPLRSKMLNLSYAGTTNAYNRRILKLAMKMGLEGTATSRKSWINGVEADVTVGQVPNTQTSTAAEKDIYIGAINGATVGGANFFYGEMKFFMLFDGNVPDAKVPQIQALLDDFILQTSKTF